MRKLVIAAAFFTLAAAAGEPRQCPNPDVLNSLVFRHDGLRLTVTGNLPAQLDGFRAPEGFQLVGTGVRQDGGSTTVAYKADLPRAAAYGRMLAAMGTGWEVERAPLGGGLTTGSTTSRLYSGSLCRNGVRRSVMAEDLGDTSYVTISLLEEGFEARACKASHPDYMPRFEFPEGSTIVAGQGGSRSMNSGSGTAGASFRINSQRGVDELNDLLAAQLVAQGWRREAGWSGKSSVGSTWRKTSEGRPGAGTLELVRLGEFQYDVDFSVVLRER